MLWDVVKVKIQCPSGTLGSKGTTHTYDINLDDLKDARGDSSLSALQQAILKLVCPHDNSLELQLSLSYLNHEGDLIPLTVQNEWDKALLEHLKTATKKSTKKALLVLAQVMNPKQNHPTIQEETPEEERAQDISNVEERLARMEELLVAMHNNINTTTGTSAATASTPHTPSRDYSSIVKDHQASLTTRLNKVKLMNATVSAATTPAGSMPNSPARIHRLAGTGTSAEPTSPPDAGAPWVPPLDHTSSASASTAQTTNSPDQLQLQEFLERMIRERQEGMQQLMESRNMELQAWQQGQSQIQAEIQTALNQNKIVVQEELDKQKAELLGAVQSKLEKLEQHRLVAQARDSVAITDALTKATQQMQLTLQEQMQQIAASVPSTSTSSTPPPPPPPMDPSVYLSALESKLEQRMDALEHMIAQANTTSARTNALVAAIPTSTSSSSSSMAPISPSKNTKTLDSHDNTKLQLDLLQQQLETSLLQKFDALEQRLQTHHLQQLNLLTDASVSNSLDADILQGMEANLMQAIGNNANANNAIANIASPHSDATTSATVTDPAMVEDLTTKLTQVIQSSQDTILHNEKQYASALRSTMIRLHKETQDNLVASLTKTLAKKLKNALQKDNGNNGVVVDWDQVKDDVQTSHAASLNQHKKEVVDCIQATQRAILTELATRDAGDKQRKRSMNPTNTTAADAITMEQMEDLVLGAVEKLEMSVGSNTEAVQAQATAVILDQLKSSHGVIAKAVVQCQDNLQGQMESSQAQVVEAIQTVQPQPAYVHSQLLPVAPQTQHRTPPLPQQKRPPSPPQPQNQPQVQPQGQQLAMNLPKPMASAASRLERLLGTELLPDELSPPPPPPKPTGRPRTDDTTVKRFLDMESRSHRLEKIYDGIKRNKNLKTAVVLTDEEEAAKTNAAAGQQQHYYEEKKEDLHDLYNNSGNHPAISMKATYQVNELGAFPTSKVAGAVPLNRSGGGGSLGGSGDWI